MLGHGAQINVYFGRMLHRNTIDMCLTYLSDGPLNLEREAGSQPNVSVYLLTTEIVWIQTTSVIVIHDEVPMGN